MIVKSFDCSSHLGRFFFSKDIEIGELILSKNIDSFHWEKLKTGTIELFSIFFFDVLLANADLGFFQFRTQGKNLEPIYF